MDYGQQCVLLTCGNCEGSHAVIFFREQGLKLIKVGILILVVEIWSFGDEICNGERLEW